MTGLEKKTQKELIEIILRKDDLEKKLREEINSIKANGHSTNVDAGDRNTKTLSKRKVWLIAIAFVLVVVVTSRLIGLLAVSIFYGVDFPTSLEQYDAVVEMISKNNGMLMLNLCVSIGVFLIEFIAIHFILHINPFKNNKSKQQ